VGGRKAGAGKIIFCDEEIRLQVKEKLGRRVGGIIRKGEENTGSNR
jgi:hypothetical protein